MNYTEAVELYGYNEAAYLAHFKKAHCRICKREVDPWPLLKRSCSPKDWKLCITTDPDKWVDA